MEQNYIRIAGKFILRRRIGGGSFGEIFLGYKLDTSEEVAIKLENVNCKFPQVIGEAKMLKILSGPGVPKVHWYGTEGSFNIMVMELLGTSLEEQLKKCEGPMSLKSVIMIGDQIYQRIEYIHNKSYIHRDIKPDNFMLGTGKRTNKVYIIDFGLAKKYRDPKTRQHIPFRDNRTLTGTARYASVNSHMGIEQSRRDDVEAIFYVMLYLIKEGLPWQGLTGKNKQEKYHQIMEMKMNMTPDALCRGLPPEFPTLLNYIKSLRFEDTPDYEYLRKTITQMARHDKIKLDNVFDWDLEEPESPGVPTVSSTGSLKKPRRTKKRKASLKRRESKEIKSGEVVSKEPETKLVNLGKPSVEAESPEVEPGSPQEPEEIQEPNEPQEAEEPSTSRSNVNYPEFQDRQRILEELQKGVYRVKTQGTSREPQNAQCLVF